MIAAVAPALVPEGPVPLADESIAQVIATGVEDTLGEEDTATEELLSE